MPKFNARHGTRGRQGHTVAKLARKTISVNGRCRKNGDVVAQLTLRLGKNRGRNFPAAGRR